MNLYGGSGKARFGVTTKEQQDLFQTQKDYPLYKDLWRTLWSLKREMEFHHVKKLAVPKLGCGLDQLNWRTVRNMLEVVFRGTGIQVLVCTYQPKRILGQEKKQDTNYRKAISRKERLAVTVQ
ncbi:hypothetical protein RN001_011409 [Aquatica leii]|uniref:Macro domain-containing protein n=1 Tax=Aquatica leii TaxID=1421715 RepID=A0AAN7PSV3_9COLE|nr:hypothetical protein RN001_011409 [Aquatica leii]